VFALLHSHYPPCLTRLTHRTAWPAPTLDDDLVLVGDLLFRIPKDLKVLAYPRGFHDEQTFLEKIFGRNEILKPTVIGGGLYKEKPYEAAHFSFKEIIYNKSWLNSSYGHFSFGLSGSYDKKSDLKNASCQKSRMESLRDYPKLLLQNIKDPAGTDNRYIPIDKNPDGSEGAYIFRDNEEKLFNKNIEFRVHRENTVKAPEGYKGGRIYKYRINLSNRTSISFEISDFVLKGISPFDAIKLIEAPIRNMWVKSYQGMPLWPHDLGECPKTQP
jgi:hypothetical protein